MVVRDQKGSKTTKKTVNGRWRAQLWEDTSAIKREVNHQQTEPKLSQQQEGTHAGSGTLLEPYLRLLKRYKQNRGQMPSDITQLKDGLSATDQTIARFANNEKQPQTAEPRGPGEMNPTPPSPPTA